MENNERTEIWDSKRETEKRTSTGIFSAPHFFFFAVWSCAFHDTGLFVVSASMDKTCKLFDLGSQVCANSLHPFFFVVTARWWPLSSHVNLTVIVFFLQKCRQTLRGHVDSVNSVTFQPYTNNVCTGSSDKTVSLWDVRTGTATLCFASIYLVQNSVLGVCWFCREVS